MHAVVNVKAIYWQLQYTKFKAWLLLLYTVEALLVTTLVSNYL